MTMTKMKIGKDAILWGAVGIGAVVVGLMIYGVKMQIDRRSPL